MHIPANSMESGSRTHCLLQVRPMGKAGPRSAEVLIPRGIIRALLQVSEHDPLTPGAFKVLSMGKQACGFN